jgi:putative PIN family toxin of toxin-antitoxin system
LDIVIDANIFISSHFWQGNPKIVVDRVIGGMDVLYITDDVMAEIEKTFQKPKFYLTNNEAKQQRVQIEGFAHKVTVFPEHKITGVCRHQKDEKYIECALAAGASYIISGDKHLRQVKEYRDIRIVTAKEYLNIVTPSALF